MKREKIIAFAVVAVVMTAGCSKDNDGERGRYRLFAEDMAAGGGAKVLVNPGNGTAQWLTGETININNHVYTIGGNASDGYSVNTGEDALGATLYAIYPGSSFGGNDVTVTHTGSGSGNEVVINNLVLNFHNDGKHDVVFPMSTAGITAESGTITFEHLTGGMKLTLSDISDENDYTLGSLRIVTYGDGATAPTIEARNGVTARWAVQGPAVPGGMVGETVGDVSVMSASEMHFTLSTDGNPGKAIPHDGSISLCVPVTINSVKVLQVTGYNPDGVQLFSRSKTLPSAVTIERNKMYTIPMIEL